ncbi:MAG: hypothetical protein FWF44_01645 [Defluviitaleaceae bacterium]|nr:hypothetical protein [Defluviitaleaceae bacterium]
MDYSWQNDGLWQIKITAEDFADFTEPYIGNGILGVRFGKLVMGADRLNPMGVFSKAVYDGGQQLPIPAWHHVALEAGGVSYTPENGRHSLTQTLDMRGARVSLEDHWEYAPGKAADIRAEMFVPRTYGNASYLGVEISCEEAVSATFGIFGQEECYDAEFSLGGSADGVSRLIGDYRTKIQNRPVAQVLRWNLSGFSIENGQERAKNGEIRAVSGRAAAKLEIFHALSSYAESDDPRSAAIQAADTLARQGRNRLLDVSETEWKRLWSSALAFETEDFATAQSLLAHQFYLLCSLEDCPYPLAPLGLSSNCWGGNQLWDADLWVFRAILPMWPEYARSIFMFRRRTLDAAKELARVCGYRGAWYPFIADDEGRNITPAQYNDELHLNVWIALAGWEYWLASKDAGFLRNDAWPVISAVADFFASRTEVGLDGKYHLLCVLGPDESVAECGQMRVNDNFVTNLGVIRVMEIALAAADILGEAPGKDWKRVAGAMFLPAPNAYGIFPEYAGYTEHGIKQADVILAFYPLGIAAAPEVTRRNLIFYRDKQMYYGPMMSAQIEACAYMRLGEKERGLKILFEGVREFMRGPHYILFECRGNNKSVMLTGIAGELQALIYGYYGAEADNAGGAPRIGEYM